MKLSLIYLNQQVPCFVFLKQNLLASSHHFSHWILMAYVLSASSTKSLVSQGHNCISITFASPAPSPAPDFYRHLGSVCQPAVKVGSITDADGRRY